MNPRNKNFLIGLVVVVMAIVFMNIVSTNRAAPREIIYSEFLTQVRAGQVANVTLEEGTIQGELSDGTVFTTFAPKDPGLVPLLRNQNVHITVNPDAGTPWYLSILLHWGPFLLIIGIWIFLMRRMQGTGNRLFSLGKSRARRIDEKTKTSTFADVAGVEEAKQELVEIIEFLRDPAKFRKLGGRIPKGVLMVGPPGTGKTLLARAVAGEAGVPFFSISGSDFVEMFVGVGASRVRDLFDEGRKNAPCLLFIDEIDAVGRHRGAGLGSGHDEREQTLNQLLVEMDGFDSADGVIIIAATNRPDVLDPALLRPGRFDRMVHVPLPDMRGRERILGIHTAKVSVAPGTELSRVAKGTPGFSGADLRNLVNEAALFAARKNKAHVELSDLEWARDKVMIGPERKSMLMSDAEKRNTAYHEAGHALVGALTPKADPVHKITIVPRGQALGVTAFLPVEDVHTHDRDYLVGRIMVAMGGRAAEELIFGEITTGAKDDIVSATRVARNMVCLYGMSEALGPISLDPGEQQHFLGRDIGVERAFGEDTAEIVDEEVAKLVKGAYLRAKKLLSDNLDKLHTLARRLIEKETVDHDELAAILSPLESSAAELLSRMHFWVFRAFPKRALTRIAGWLAGRRHPRWLLRIVIRAYIRAYRIDMAPFEGAPESFETFNGFFTRPLRAGQRPVDPDPAAVVSPVDGTISAFSTIEQGRLIQAKGRDYSLEALLGGDPAWRDYLGGQYVTLYLAPPDYHRIHAPITGTVRRFRYIPGEFWSVSTAGLESVPRLYERNERLVTYLEGEFGGLALIAVGAMIVGGIRVVYHRNPAGTIRPGARGETLSIPHTFGRGAELGRFELGSSVVLLTRPGDITYSPMQVGQRVRMGQAIGRIVSRP